MTVSYVEDLEREVPALLRVDPARWSTTVVITRADVISDAAWDLLVEEFT